MKTSDILSKLMAKKGQFGRMTWEKKLKTYKGVSDVITKQTTMSMRAGIDYNNLKVVQEKRENGQLPAIPQSLPWGNWIPGFEPYLIEHKGNYYARVYPNANGTIKTIYKLNGSVIDLDSIRHMLLASELPSEGNKPDCITVTLANITELV